MPLPLIVDHLHGSTVRVLPCRICRTAAQPDAGRAARRVPYRRGSFLGQALCRPGLSAADRHRRAHAARAGPGTRAVARVRQRLSSPKRRVTAGPVLLLAHCAAVPADRRGGAASGPSRCVRLAQATFAAGYSSLPRYPATAAPRTQTDPATCASSTPSSAVGGLRAVLGGAGRRFASTTAGSRVRCSGIDDPGPRPRWNSGRC